MTPDVSVTVPDGASHDAACGDGCGDAGPGLQESVCGDGVVASDEGCDDGNLLPGDGCNAICQVERCGNGIVDLNEHCEPPGRAGCTDGCKLRSLTCGNGMVEPEAGEQCDDGNTAKGDGCRDCLRECGDAILDREIGEECEPIFTARDAQGESTTCTRECRLKPYCGDGKLSLERGEECDPPNGMTCVADCRRARERSGAGVCQPLPDAGATSEPRANLLLNGEFAADLAGWTAGRGVQAVFAADEGYPAPGAARITYTTGAAAPGLSVDGITRCLSVSAGELYDLEAYYLNPPAQPAGARAFFVVLLYPNPTCAGVAVPGGVAGSNAESTVGRWLPYRVQLDTTAIGHAGQQVSVLIKLGVVAPSGTSATALWDSVSLRSGAFSPNCGNCVVDPGENCDDGNRAGGDGCSALCRNELLGACGNRRVEPGEACDTGATSFRGAGECTPVCSLKDGCFGCSASQCAMSFDACLGLEGVAEAGLGKGLARGELCARMRDCVARSGCAERTVISSRQILGNPPIGSATPALENCYCGNSALSCLLPGAANGSCQREIEAVLETRDPVTIVNRMGGADPRYPGFALLRDLRACEQSKCRLQCTVDLRCGNGVVQERPESFKGFTLNVGGRLEACTDARTPSGRGCSFEECDGGPGCDENCFLLACGNGLLQAGEGCDDGNRVAGDGCSPTCRPEFTCGDGVVASAFGEQCDPPRPGPTCSLSQYMSEPSQCGCGPTCHYKVCGNGILQEGEACDPPNGTTCGPDCTIVGVNECVGCMLLAGDAHGDAPFNSLLLGPPGNPELPGCQTIPACFSLLNCLVQDSCWRAVSPTACYCGVMPGDLDGCEPASFVPRGPCNAEFTAAFRVQAGRAPRDNAEVLDAYYRIEPGQVPAVGLATLAADMAFSELERGLRAARAAGAPVTEEKIQECNRACFGRR